MDTFKKKGARNSYRSPFMSLNMFRNIPYSEIDLAEIDVLIQSGFRVIRTIGSTNLYKTCLVVIIIPFFTFHFERKKLGKMKKN